MADRESEYKRLRKYLNKVIRGKNTDAILRSVASGPAHLVNNIEAVNDSLYIVTASQKYLDSRLGDKGVVRPPEVGLSDEVFREIGIEITNRKQVRDLVHQLLRILYGEVFTRATSASEEVENFSLEDGDNLIMSFDDAEPVEIAFNSSQFQNINNATAQEVADAITKSIKKVGGNGAAFARQDDGVTRVVLISFTDGPSSSVKVLGGKAQNALKFDKIRPTAADATTQWTLTQEAGGAIRATWSGGANPSIGKVKAGDYVNIYGNNFSSENRGTFNVTEVKSGPVNEAYVEYENPEGIAEGGCSINPSINVTPALCSADGGVWSPPVVQGSDDAILFYNPITRTVISNLTYAAAFQTSPRTLEVFIPATTKVVRRNRAGAAHIYTHVPEKTQITFPSLAELQSGDSFLLNSFLNSTKYRVIYNIDDSIIDKNFSEKVLEININSSEDITASDIAAKTYNRINDIYNFSCNNNQDGSIEITNTTGGNSFDVESINMPPSFLVDVIIQGTNVVSNEGQVGPYSYDTTVGYTIGEQAALTTEELDASSDKILFVDNSTQFPDEQGDLIIGFGTSHQEGPVPYISRPSNQTLRINPSYEFKQKHPKGTDVTLIAEKKPANPNKDGSDYPFYLTDSVAGRIYAQDLIQEITATGIVVVFYVLYPNDIGLGNWGDEENSEKYYIWGTEEDL